MEGKNTSRERDQLDTQPICSQGLGEKSEVNPKRKKGKYSTLSDVSLWKEAIVGRQVGGASLAVRGGVTKVREPGEEVSRKAASWVRKKIHQ